MSSIEAKVGALDGRRLVVAEVLLRAALLSVIMGWLHHVFYADVSTYFYRAEHIGWHDLPYRDFLWEYPPLAALPLLLIPLVGRSNEAFHVAFLVCTVGLEYWMLHRFRRGRSAQERSAITWWWNLSVLPLAAIAWFRLDFVPATCATVALFAMAEGRRWVLATFAGFATKLWPIVLVVPMVLRRRYRDVVVTCLWAASMVVAWWLFSPQGFHDFLRFRQGAGFQVESLPGALVMLLDDRPISFVSGALVVGDEGLGWVQRTMAVVLVLAPAAMVVAAWRRRSSVDQVALVGAIVTTTLLSQRLLSPQFLVWLVPFVAWYRFADRTMAWVFGVGAWMTALVVQCYGSFLNRNTVLVSMVVVRNAMLLWIIGRLLQLAFRHRTAASVPSDAPAVPAAMTRPEPASVD